MVIKMPNPFKSQTIDRNKIGRDVHAVGRTLSANVYPSAKKAFEFDTTLADNNSAKLELEHTGNQTSLFLDIRTDVHAERKLKISSIILVAKRNIVKLFKPTSHAPETVVCIDPFGIPSVEHSAWTRHGSSFLPIPRHPEVEVHAVVTTESILPRRTGSGATAPFIHYSPKSGLTSTAHCDLAESPSRPLTAQLSMKPCYHHDSPPTVSFLSGLHTSEERNRYDEGHKYGSGELSSGPYISRSDSDSKAIVHLSNGTLSDYAAAREFGSFSSGADMLSVDTSFATSVDAEDSRRLRPGALRGLRRVPHYEDLRNLLLTTDRSVPYSVMSCESSSCDSSYGTISGKM